MRNKLLLSGIAFLTGIFISSSIVLASEQTGTLNTGIATGLSGTVIAAPTFSPAAGTYTSAQSVTMTAAGSTAICYRTDGSAPACGSTPTTCASGSTLYSSAVNVSSTRTFKALSCYAGDDSAVLSSSVVTKTYTINIPSGGGGGGGGGISIPTLSTVPSATTEYFTTTVDVPSTGMAVRPTLIKNPATGASLFIQKDTHITTATGASYDGTISPPSAISESKLPAPLPPELDFSKAIVIEATGKLFFDKDVTITIPLPEGADLARIKIYFYNSSTGEYQLLDGGGTVSADGKFISVNTNHLTTFVAAETLEVAVPFTDIQTHWAATYIEQLYKMGVVQGRTPTLFKPDASLTRAELVKIAMITFGYEITEGAVPSFTDVSSSAWYAKFIAAAADAGVVSGYATGKFKPDAPVNRAEALKILLEAAQKKLEEVEAAPFTDVAQDEWFAKYVNYAYANGIVSGKTALRFAPGDNVSRAEMTKMTVKVLGL